MVKVPANSETKPSIPILDHHFLLEDLALGRVDVRLIGSKSSDAVSEGRESECVDSLRAELSRGDLVKCGIADY